MEAKKVNNMPNLQSMSQAKGYGRLHKKSSETLCLDEIDRMFVLFIASKNLIYPLKIEGSFLFVDIKF